jgi:hypothetical protein
VASREPFRLSAAVAAAVVAAAALWLVTELAIGLVCICVYGKDEVPPIVETLATVAPWLVAVVGGIAAGRSVLGGVVPPR